MVVSCREMSNYASSDILCGCVSLTAFDSVGGSNRRHEGGNAKGDKFHRERNDGFGGDTGAKPNHQTHDSDSGGEKSQRPAHNKQSYHNGDDMGSQQARENNRSGNERHHDKQHFQKPSTQQGNVDSIGNF
jgi:hypothetical protein